MLNKINFKTKLAVILLVPLIILVIVVYLLNSSSKTMSSDLIYTLHEESFTGSNLILNADRDMYQALLAKSKIFDLEPNTSEFDQQVKDYQENVEQAKDRVGQAMSILEQRKEKWNSVKLESKSVFEYNEVFEKDFNEWINSTDLVIAELKKGVVVEYDSTIDASFESAREGINAIGELLETIAGEIIIEKQAEQERLTNVIIYTTGITLIIVLLLGIMLVRSVIKPVQELSKQGKIFGSGDLTVKFMTKGRDEISQMAVVLDEMAVNLREAVRNILANSQSVYSSAHNLAAVAQEQSATTEEINSQASNISDNSTNVSAIVEEVGTSVQEVSISAKSAAESVASLSGMAQDAGKEAIDGDIIIQDIRKEMTNVNKEVKETSELVRYLAGNAQSIEEIVNLIRSIAGQTNLLSLNAAVEASRAGEAGRGFAVVADEIRKLAENSEVATQKISDILQDIQQDSQRADQATHKVVDMIDKITTEVERASQQFSLIKDKINGVLSKSEELAAESQEQSATAEEMAKAMEMATESVVEVVKQVQEMVIGIEQQSQGAQQVSESSETLSELANKQEEAVKRFTI